MKMATMCLLLQNFLFFSLEKRAEELNNDDKNAFQWDAYRLQQ